MNSLKNFFEIIKKELINKKPVILCMVVQKQGSAPRGVGAHMLVLSDGTTIDTIGGGVLEFSVKNQALENLKAGISSFQEFSLDNNKASDAGMICGGHLKVLLQYLDDTFLKEIEKALQIIEENQQIVISIDWQNSDFLFAIHSINENFLLKDEMVSQRKKSLLQVLNVKENKINGSYREIFAQKPTVFLFGGGYVAQAVAKLLPDLEFPYIVIEEREEFANNENFPHAEKIIITSYENFSRKVQIRNSDFVIVVTSGHQKDTLILNELLKNPPLYLGAIGSRRKKAIIGKYLLEQGYTKEKINSIVLPIGLDIGANTPAEIAVSIVAQLIEKRSKL